MGFYGDWAQAPVMEQLDWIDVMTDNTDVSCNTWPNLAYLAAIRGNSITSSSLAGTNPFDSELDLRSMRTESQFPARMPHMRSSGRCTCSR